MGRTSDEERNRMTASECDRVVRGIRELAVIGIVPLLTVTGLTVLLKVSTTVVFTATAVALLAGVTALPRRQGSGAERFANDGFDSNALWID